jgi:hypothetical protein
VKPYVLVRGGLWARFTRALALELIDLGFERTMGGKEQFGVESGGIFFSIEPKEEEVPAP